MLKDQLLPGSREDVSRGILKRRSSRGGVLTLVGQKILTAEARHRPKVRKVGIATPPLPAVTNSPTNAPVAPLYSSTALPSSLQTKRLPFEPNTTPSASLRPPSPAVTKLPSKAPVVPSYRFTSLVAALLTNRSPSGPKTRSVGSSGAPLSSLATNLSMNVFVLGS